MRVLLINPFYPVSETPSPPLGLAFLAAALEAAGIEVVMGAAGTVREAVEAYKAGNLKATGGPNVESHAGMRP